MDPISITPGFAPQHRAQAARLFWEAFRAKLNPVMGPEEKAVAFISHMADPSHAISATAADGTLLGLAGYKTDQGSFIGGDWPDLTAIYGTLSSLWRAPLLHLLERKLEPGVLLMDGIFVSEAARGQGIGTLLLGAIKQEAKARGLSQVRLDVIDTNPRARALYEREGFTAGRTTKIGPLRHVFGFRHATAMVFTHDALNQP